MFQYIHNVNAYVEEDKRYQSDNVRLELDEDTFQVTVVAVDVYDAVVPDVAPIVDKTLESFEEGLEFYESMAHQLHEGDIIRHVNAGYISQRRLQEFR